MISNATNNKNDFRNEMKNGNLHNQNDNHHNNLNSLNDNNRNSDNSNNAAYNRMENLQNIDVSNNTENTLTNVNVNVNGNGNENDTGHDSNDSHESEQYETASHSLHNSQSDHEQLSPISSPSSPIAIDDIQDIENIENIEDIHDIHDIHEIDHIDDKHNIDIQQQQQHQQQNQQPLKENKRRNSIPDNNDAVETPTNSNSLSIDYNNNNNSNNNNGDNRDASISPFSDNSEQGGVGGGGKDPYSLISPTKSQSSVTSNNPSVVSLGLGNADSDIRTGIINKALDPCYKFHSWFEENKYKYIYSIQECCYRMYQLRIPEFIADMIVLSVVLLPGCYTMTGVLFPPFRKENELFNEYANYERGYLDIKAKTVNGIQYKRKKPIMNQRKPENNTASLWLDEDGSICGFRCIWVQNNRGKLVVAQKYSAISVSLAFLISHFSFLVSYFCEYILELLFFHILLGCL